MEPAIAKEFCATTTMNKIKEGVLIVDVREMVEIDQFTFDVPNYLALPLTEFEEKFNSIPKDKEIVLVCRGGSRSLKATYFLMNHGYDKVANMSGGILKWHAKGFPTKGTPEESNASSGCCGSSAEPASSEPCCGDSHSSCC